MDNPWITHGLSMDNPRIIHGQSIDYQCIIHRLSMDNPWIIHGLSVDNPWIIHGYSMDYPWLPFLGGLSMDYPCPSLSMQSGLSMHTFIFYTLSTPLCSKDHLLCANKAKGNKTGSSTSSNPFCKTYPLLRVNKVNEETITPTGDPKQL